MSASTSPFADLCAVCDEPGSQRCGACLAVKFCSRRCQTLLWPSHKVLCGRDPNTFYLPRPSNKELEALKQLNDEPYKGASTFLEAMGIPWITFLALMCEDQPTGPVVTYYRVKARLTAYHRLALALDDQDPRVDVPPSPWALFAEDGLAWLKDYSLAVRPFSISREQLDDHVVATALAGRSSFTVLNAILRQELVSSTVQYQAGRSPPRIGQKEAVPLLTLSVHRGIKELYRVDLPEEQRERFEARWLCRDR